MCFLSGSSQWVACLFLFSDCLSKIRICFYLAKPDLLFFSFSTQPFNPVPSHPFQTWPPFIAFNHAEFSHFFAKIFTCTSCHSPIVPVGFFSLFLWQIFGMEWIFSGSLHFLTTSSSLDLWNFASFHTTLPKLTSGCHQKTSYMSISRIF